MTEALRDEHKRFLIKASLERIPGKVGVSTVVNPDFKPLGIAVGTEEQRRRIAEKFVSPDPRCN